MTVDIADQLRAMRAGDSQAGSELMERFRPFVLGRLRAARRARNWFWLDDPEDATQEVLVRFVEAVMAGRFAYRDEAQLKGFLVRTAFFEVMGRRDEHLAAWPTAEDDPPPHTLSAAAIAAFDLHQFADASFDQLGRRQCLEELYQAVDALGEARAEVLRLTLLGLAPRDIAPLMGRSTNAVSVLKTHALNDLRAGLEATDFMANCGRYFLGG